MTERSICQVKASVMLFNKDIKKWEPAGNSRVHVFHNTSNNIYRMVGRTILHNEVVINFAIVKNFIYIKATPNFHQFRDERKIYGLNFQSADDAKLFSETIASAINIKLMNLPPGQQNGSAEQNYQQFTQDPFQSGHSLSERSICQVKASVMLFNKDIKKWEPAGNSRVHVFHNTSNNIYRIVGRKILHNEVVINFAIVKNFIYIKATPNFHQFRDERKIYGLNFQSADDAKLFSETIASAIKLMNLPPATANTTDKEQHFYDENLCKICMDSIIDCVLLECGHLVTCTKCGRQLAECPICRRMVARVVHVFKA